MKLEVLTKDDCEQTRIWRNEWLVSLRTPYPLTKEQQEQFYHDVICNRNSPHRYWGIHEDGVFIGMGGLAFIEWENRIAEISLILNPAKRNIGYGKQAVCLLLEQGFNHLGLKTIYGEVYACNEAFGFWKKIANVSENNKGCWVILPNRKLWGGIYHNSAYFSFDRGDFGSLNKRLKGVT